MAVERASFTRNEERETGMRDWREVPLWRDVPPEKWDAWRLAAGHAVKSPEDLRQGISPAVTEDRGIP